MASRALGTLTLDLLVKLGAFQEGMDKASRVADQNSKKIQQAMAETEARANQFANSLKSAFAVVGVGASINNFITQTSNAQNEQAQLAAVLKSTGEAAGWTQQQLNKMAKEMSSTAGGSLFSEGDITQAQTRLLSYSNIVGEQFPQAMQATIDMASRMGMSVTQAAETIGKALDVPSEGYSALTRQGFRFTNEQKRLIEEFEKTGQAAEAQKVIIDVLAASYDGAAKAARDTLAGDLKALRDNSNNLFTDADGGSQLRSMLQGINDLLSSEEAKAGAQALLAVMQALAPAAGAYFALWGLSKVKNVVSGIVSTQVATAKLAKQNMELAIQEQRRMQTLTFLAAKEAQAAQGTAVQTEMSIALANARMAERQADIAAAAAKEQYARATSLAGTAVKALGGWMGIASLAVSAGVAVFGAMEGKTTELKDSLIDLKLPIEDVVAQFNAMTAARKKLQIAILENNLLHYQEEAKKLVESLKDSVSQMGALSNNLDRLRPIPFIKQRALDDENSEIAKMLASLAELDQTTEGYQEKLDAMSNAIVNNTRLTQDEKQKHLESIAVLEDGKKKVDEITKSILAFTDALNGMAGASVNAGADLDKALGEWNRRFATKAEKEQYQAIDDVSEAFRKFSADPPKLVEALKTLNNYKKDQNSKTGTSPYKLALDDSASEIQAALENYERIYSRGLRELEILNENHMLSLNEFYAQQSVLLDAYTQEQVKAIDAQIAAQKKYAGTEGLRKLNELYRQRQKILDDATDKEFEAANAQQKALKDLEKQFQTVNLSWLDYKGLAEEAAAIRFDQQYSDLKKIAEINGQTEISAMIADLEKGAIASAKFSAALAPVQSMFSSLQYSEQMLSVSQQLGGVGELGSLAQLGKLRRGQFEELTIQLEKLKEVINSGDATPKMVEDFRQLDLQLKQLQAGLDPLGAKFADVFSGAMEDPLFDFLEGTKSAGEAFSSMINQMISDLGRLAMQDGLSRLFKSMGGGSGFFSYLGGLFGNAKGGVYSSPGLSAYSGQIVSQPTVFAFAKGAGLMGEAGPEAIMPLTRSANGELAVKAVGEQLQKDGGKSAINISNTVNVTSSGTSVSTQSNNNEARYQQLNRGIEEAVRQVIAREMRQGGIFWKGR